MKLTQKLLGFLHRVFSPDPDQFMAVQLGYDGDALTWTVADGVLTTVVTGGQGEDMQIDLTAYTIGELVDLISAQPGYSVVKATGSANRGLGARILIDGTGELSDEGNGKLYAYTNLTWAVLDAFAVELQAAKTQIPLAIEQLSLSTANDEWLDELGGYYGIKRTSGELDTSYGPRIVATVLRPACNNVSIAKAISYYTGQDTTVTDVTIYGAASPLYDSEITRNGQYNYLSKVLPEFGLFDVEYGYDLLSGDDPSTFADRVKLIIESIRAAGTQMRALSLQASAITDTCTAPTETVSAVDVAQSIVETLDAPSESDVVLVSALTGLADTADAASDAFSGTLVYDYKYNSIRYRNGAIYYTGGTYANTL